MLRLLSIPLGLIVAFLASMVWSGGGVQPRADFTFINRGDLYTLDLNEMSYLQDFRITYAIREGLFSYDSKTFQPIPAGAISSEHTPDNKSWTFHLRPGCKWTNGDPVTAKDYVFSWRRMLESPGEYTYLYYYIKGAQQYSDDYSNRRPADFAGVGVEMPDAMTLKLTLAHPVPFLPDLLAFPPFYPRNERSMEPFKEPPGATDHYSYRGEYTRPPAVVTNGPFEMAEWSFKRRVLLKKSDTYWDKAHVRCDSIEMAVNDDALSQFLAYETEQVDWQSAVDAVIAAELKAKGRKDLRTSPAFGTMFFTLLCTPELPADFGGGKNPLADVRVRQALTMSINKRFITDQVTRMGEVPARTYVPIDGTLVGFTWPSGPFDPDKSKRYTFDQLQKMFTSDITGPGPGLPYDPARAKELLAEAGYENGKGFPRLPVMFGTNSPTNGQICQVLKAQWKQVLNIDVDIQSLEGKVLREKIAKKDYVIAPASWYGDYPDAATYSDKYRSDSNQNDAGFVSKTYDALCDQALEEPDADKRRLLLSSATQMLDEQVPIIPIYYYVNVSLSRDNVHGVDPNPRGETIFKDVYVERN